MKVIKHADMDVVEWRQDVETGMHVSALTGSTQLCIFEQIWLDHLQGDVSGCDVADRADNRKGGFSANWHVACALCHKRVKRHYCVELGKQDKCLLRGK